MDIVISEESAKSVTDRWPAECRDLAYQLWAFVCGRNAAKVAAMLADRGSSVPERTVQYWASSGEWAKRASDDLGRIAPDIRQQTIAELIYGGLEAARGLRSVVVGDLPGDIEAGIRAADDDLAAGVVDATERKQRVDDLLNRAERLLKTRTTAYVAMLDRAGFSPVGSNAPELPRVSVAEQAKAYRDMTPEERIEEQRRQLDAQRLPAKTARRRR